MSDNKRTVHCEVHGDQQETFVCRHVAETLQSAKPVGFWWADDRHNPRPDAWCTACNEVLREEGGEWNKRSESFADIKLLCGGCYDRARDLNFPQYPQF
jgi:hypothetical protein